LQAEQLGTAHAVMQAMPQVSADADVLVLYGDVPLVRAATLKRLLEAAREGLALLTAEPDDPAAYGRIVRDATGRVKRIVELRDASPAERAIREINAGFYALAARRLAEWLKKIDNRNAQKEYYLTDLVGLAVGEGTPVVAVKTEHAWEAAGVNSKAELAQLERQYQANTAQKLLEAGVTCFVDLTAWGRQAEVLSQYVKKGSQLFIEGRLDYSTWESPEGGKRSKLEVVVENFQFVGSGAGRGAGGGGGSGGEEGGGGGGGGRRSSPGRSKPAQQEGGGGGGGGNGGEVDYGDIPF
jgi:UDP-N-acetylglucosamine diphosphorylase/glucosamine-1-phosphate N-acetyltransferase